MDPGPGLTGGRRCGLAATAPDAPGAATATRTGSDTHRRERMARN